MKKRGSTIGSIFGPSSSKSTRNKYTTPAVGRMNARRGGLNSLSSTMRSMGALGSTGSKGYGGSGAGTKASGGPSENPLDKTEDRPQIEVGSRSSQGFDAVSAMVQARMGEVGQEVAFTQPEPEVEQHAGGDGHNHGGGGGGGLSGGKGGSPTGNLVSWGGYQFDSGVVGYLQRLQAATGLKVSSGYRSPSHNKRVGGVPNSNHLTGRAADFSGSSKQMQAGAAWARANGAREVLIHNAGSGMHLHVAW